MVPLSDASGAACSAGAVWFLPGTGLRLHSLPPSDRTGSCSGRWRPLRNELSSTAPALQWRHLTAVSGRVGAESSDWCLSVSGAWLLSMGRSRRRPACIASQRINGIQAGIHRQAALISLTEGAANVRRSAICRDQPTCQWSGPITTRHRRRLANYVLLRRRLN